MTCSDVKSIIIVIKFFWGDKRVSSWMINKNVIIRKIEENYYSLSSLKV